MDDAEGEPKRVFRDAVRDAEAAANATRSEREGIVQYHYPDYDTYRAVQSAGNKAKLGAQYVSKTHIFALAERLNDGYGPVAFGLCHGVRRGKEQGWFRRRLPRGAEVIGTDISDTATRFPSTVQWDFHDENPDWAGRADFVYSNSWDHAFDPARAFRAWHAALKPGGWMLLDHTRGHAPTGASALDPFGATWEALRATISEALGPGVEELEPLDRTADAKYPARVLITRKR